MTRPSDKKVWFVTGAGRGMDVDIANARRATTKIKYLTEVPGRCRLHDRSPEDPTKV
jgi:hypothetical protein